MSTYIIDKIKNFPPSDDVLGMLWCGLLIRKDVQLHNYTYSSEKSTYINGFVADVHRVFSYL